MHAAYPLASQLETGNLMYKSSQEGLYYRTICPTTCVHVINTSIFLVDYVVAPIVHIE